MDHSVPEQMLQSLFQDLLNELSSQATIPDLSWTILHFITSHKETFFHDEPSYPTQLQWISDKLFTEIFNQAVEALYEVAQEISSLSAATLSASSSSSSSSNTQADIKDIVLVKCMLLNTWSLRTQDINVTQFWNRINSGLVIEILDTLSNSLSSPFSSNSESVDIIDTLSETLVQFLTSHKSHIPEQALSKITHDHITSLLNLSLSPSEEIVFTTTQILIMISDEFNTSREEGSLRNDIVIQVLRDFRQLGAWTSNFVLWFNREENTFTLTSALNFLYRFFSPCYPLSSSATSPSTSAYTAPQQQISPVSPIPSLPVSFYTSDLLILIDILLRLITNSSPSLLVPSLRTLSVILQTSQYPTLGNDGRCERRNGEKGYKCDEIMGIVGGIIDGEGNEDGKKVAKRLKFCCGSALGISEVMK